MVKVERVVRLVPSPRKRRGTQIDIQETATLPSVAVVDNPPGLGGVRFVRYGSALVVHSLLSTLINYQGMAANIWGFSEVFG